MGEEANTKDTQVKFAEPCVTPLIQLSDSNNVKLQLKSIWEKNYRAFFIVSK